MKARIQKSQQITNLSSQAAQIEQNLSAIRRAMRKPLEAEFAKGRLTMPQKDVMQAVVNNQGIRLKDLSHQLSLAHSTVSGIVDRLEKRGFLCRRPDPTDGRINRIHPSAEVTVFLRDQMPTLVTGPLYAALHRTNAAEREQISQSLHRLRQLLEVQ